MSSQNQAMQKLSHWIIFGKNSDRTLVARDVAIATTQAAIVVWGVIGREAVGRGANVRGANVRGAIVLDALKK